MLFLWFGAFQIGKPRKKFKNLFLLRRNHPENFQPRGRTKKLFVIKLRFIIVAKSVFENAEQRKKPDIKIF